MSDLPVYSPPRLPARTPGSALARGQAALARRGAGTMASMANWTPPSQRPQGVGLGDMVRNVIPGLGAMAGEIGRSALGLGRLPVDTLRMVVDRDYDPTGGDYSTSGLLGHYLPFVESTRESYAGTLQRRPGDYLQAIRDGNWMPMLIEDVGNVSLFGYGAGAAAGRIGAATGSQVLQRAAPRITQAAMLGDRFGAGPALPYLYAGRAAMRSVAPALRGIDRLYSGRTGRSLIDDARGAMDRNVWNPAPLDRSTAGVFRQSVEPMRRTLAASRLNPEVRRASRTMRQMAAEVGDAQLDVVRTLMDLERLPESVGDAALLHIRGFGEQFAALDRLPATLRQRVLAAINESVSPEAARIAREYADGTLDAATRAQMDQAVAAVRRHPEMRTERQTSRMAGESLEDFQARTGVASELNPEQLGRAPMTSAVERLTRERLGLRANETPEMRVQQRRRMADVAGERAAKARAIADARRAQTRPVVERETVRQILRRGEQTGAARQRLLDAERRARSARSELDRLVEQLVEDDRVGLTDLSVAVDEATAAFNAAADELAYALREAELTSARRPTAADELGVTRRLEAAEAELAAAREAGGPTADLEARVRELRDEQFRVRESRALDRFAEADRRGQGVFETEAAMLSAARDEVVATRQHAWREARREIDRQIAEVEGQLWAEFVEPGYQSVPARSSPFWSDYAQFAADAGFDPARPPRIRVGDRQVPLFRQQRGGRGDLGSSLEDAGVLQAGAARDAAAGRIRHLMDLRAARRDLGGIRGFVDDPTYGASRAVREYGGVRDAASAELVAGPLDESVRTLVEDRGWRVDADAAARAGDVGARVDVSAARQAARDARRDLRAAERELNRAVERGQRPGDLERAVDQAQRRFDEAQRRVDDLTREVDARSQLFLPEDGPGLRRTFREGEAAGRAEQVARALEQNERRLRRSADRLEARAAEVRAEVAKTADAAPARYRSAIKEAERGVAELKRIAEEFPESAGVIGEVIDAIPKTLDEMVEAGIDPAHLIGGRVTPRTRAALRQQRSEQLPRLGADQANVLAAREMVDYSVGNQMIQEAFRARRWQSRKAAMEFDRRFAVSPSDVLPEAVLREVAGDGAAIARAMAEYGYEAWNPKAILDWVPESQIGTVDVAAMDRMNQSLGDMVTIADMAAVTAETRFLPRALKDAFTYTMDTAQTAMAWQLLAAVNQKWKNALLPLSPSWYMGNTVGNALIAMVGEGIAPWDYPRYIMEGLRELRRTRRAGAPLADGQMQMPRRAFAAGLAYAEAQMLDPSRLTRRRPLSIAGREVGYGRFRDFAYRTNEMFDNLAKNAVYLHALEQARRNPAAQRAIYDAALSDAQAVVRTIEQRVARYADGVPEGMQRRLAEARQAVSDIERQGPANFAVAQADEYAVKRALNIVGDYHSMAPWEQKLVQVTPFYRWARHITQLTLRLPIEHPARVAWTLNLANMFAPDQSNLPEWMRGGISIGSFYMPGQFLNPWGDVTEQGGSLLSPTEFLRSVSPGIKIPVAALTGRNLARGGDPLTRPTGTGPMDRFGREDTSPPLMWGAPWNWRLGELAGYSMGQLPLTRNLRDIATGGRPLYDTGATMRDRFGRALPAREHPYGALRPLALAANLPMVVGERDLRDQARRFAENRRRYQRAVDRQGR